MSADLISFLIATFSSAAVAGLVTYIARTWISERLKQAISHEYAQKLEAHRATLKSEYDIQMERLRADNARQHAVELSARTSLEQIHLASHERRLRAVEAAWAATLAMTQARSGATIYLDILTDDELLVLPQNAKARETIMRLGEDEAIDRVVAGGQPVDALRPFIGDRVYAILFVYRAICARIEFLLGRSLQRDRFDPWWNDSGIRQHMKLVLTEQELDTIDGAPVGRFAKLRALLESKLLQELNTIISGESAVRFSVETAAAIAEAERREREIA